MLRSEYKIWKCGCNEYIIVAVDYDYAYPFRVLGLGYENRHLSEDDRCLFVSICLFLYYCGQNVAYYKLIIYLCCVKKGIVPLTHLFLIYYEEINTYRNPFYISLCGIRTEG